MALGHWTGILLDMTLNDPIAPTVKHYLFCLRSLTIKSGHIVIPYELIIVLSFDIACIFDTILHKRQGQIILI